MNKIKNLISLTRYKDYYGAVLITTAIGLHSIRPVELHDKIIITSASLLGMVFLFMFNNIEDADDDAKDKIKRKLNPLSNKSVSKNEAYIYLLLTLFISVYLYSLAGLNILVLGLITLSVGTAYSWKKIRLKALPVVDLLSHGATYALIYLIPVSLYPTRASGIEIALVAGAVFISSVLGDIKNEVRDKKVDSKAGLKNTAHFVDLATIKNYTSTIEVVVIFVVIASIMISAPHPTLILFPLTILGITIHYWKTWKSKGEFILDYPQMQRSFAATSFILLAF